MRKVRRKVLRYAKGKLYAVEACFLILVVTSASKMDRTGIKVTVSEKAYASVTEPIEAVQAEMGVDIIPEWKNLPCGYTEPTGYDIPMGGEMQIQKCTGALVEPKELEGKDVLLQIAMAEAEGEPVEGKAMVMLVVMNRVRAKEFPDSVSDVVFEPGQFTPVENGRYYSVVPDDGCQQAYEMVRGGWDESKGALYFASIDYPHTWHTNNLESLFTIGKHEFFK